MSRYIILAYASLFVLGILDNSRGAVYPILLKKFEITNSLGAMIFSVASLSGFIVSLFHKYWLRKYGAVNSTQIGLFLFFTASLFMGAAPSGVMGFYTFIFSSVLLGAGVGIFGITLNLIIAVSTDENKRRRYFSGLHSMYGIASLSAPFILSWIFHFNFKFEYFFFGISLIPLGLFIWNMKLPSLGIKQEVHKESSLKLSKLELLILSFILSFYVCSEIIIGSRIANYLKEVQNFTDAAASGQLSLFFVFLLVGRVLFTVKHFKYSNFSLLRFSLFVSLCTFCAGIWGHYIFFALTGLSMSYFFPCIMDWFGECFKEQVNGVISFVMTFLGAVLVIIHWLFGFLSDFIGIKNAMFLPIALLVISLYLLQFHTNFSRQSYSKVET